MGTQLMRSIINGAHNTARLPPPQPPLPGRASVRTLDVVGGESAVNCSALRAEKRTKHSTRLALNVSDGVITAP